MIAAGSSAPEKLLGVLMQLAHSRVVAHSQVGERLRHRRPQRVLDRRKHIGHKMSTMRWGPSQTMDIKCHTSQRQKRLRPAVRPKLPKGHAVMTTEDTSSSGSAPRNNQSTSTTLCICQEHLREGPTYQGRGLKEKGSPAPCLTHLQAVIRADGWGVRYRRLNNT
jgi:hypothetical protein